MVRSILIISIVLMLLAFTDIAHSLGTFVLVLAFYLYALIATLKEK